MASPLEDFVRHERRRFLLRSATGLGGIALAELLRQHSAAAPVDSEMAFHAPKAGLPDFKPSVRRVIYLFQSGAPSQLDLFDYKPHLADRFGEELPDSIRGEQRLTGMTAGQESHPVAPSTFQFHRRGKSGIWISEALPHIGRIADDITLIRSLHTAAINHDPAVTFLMTGTERTGRPSLGAWTAYGLGSENQNLPAFVVMISQGSGRPNGQPLYQRLWGSGFLPTNYQGVKFRSVGDPVLYLNNPPGLTSSDRRYQLDALARLNEHKRRQFLDPEIQTRISQYELAYRMQSSVPDLLHTNDETEETFRLYGEAAKTPGTFAANCLLARRLAERGVRFIQLFHRGWDQHRDLPRQLRGQCQDTDQASAALVQDLKQRGMLDDTLVVWGGEFGRTVYCQEKLTKVSYGRDHHPRCFAVWLAGGGIRRGFALGRTDDFSYNIVEDPLEVHDLHATILHQLGIDHERFTHPFQGREHRLTDVRGRVVQEILAG